MLVLSQALSLAPWIACRAPDPPAGALVWEPSPHVPAAGTVSFEVPEGARAEVQVLRGDLLDRVLPTAVEGGAARATLVGLRSGERYTLTAQIDGSPGPSLQITAPEAPELLSFSLDPASAPEVAAADDGYVLVAMVDLEASAVGVLDGRDGTPVWWYEVDPSWTAASPRPSLDGRSILFPINDRDRDSEDQRALRVAIDGSAIEEQPVPAAHHMVAEIDEDSLAWMAWDIGVYPWGPVEEEILSDKILLGERDGPPETLLSFFDALGPPYIPCSHGLVEDERLGQSVYEWSHANSIVYLDTSDEILVGARLLDAVIAIDRETGALKWQMGGRGATLPYDDPADAFSHGHFSDAWEGGMLMFDNGSHALPDPHTRIVEYEIGSDGAHIVWEYPAPDGLFVEFLGDARRLPDTGDVLVAWSTLVRIEEITRGGQVVWGLQGASSDQRATLGRIWFLPAFP